ncbi:uncharacterized protein LOC134715817 [Mytilus trossulus]|uniref:uncharacterized protein LOC134715817 n=1 Tax=Mytilus trossulus TaxID=6551 RepID=UPI003003A89F
MSNQIDAVIWLSVNYVNEKEECDTKLTDVYEACIAFYSLKKQAPPSKELIGKLIPRIFGVSSSFKFDNSKRIVVYKHLKVRPQSNSLAIIPAHCSTLKENIAYTLRYPLQTVVDGEQQFCDVTFGKDDTWLTINNMEFKTGYPLEINQKNVDGMLKVICSLKLCTGIKNQAVIISNAFFKENCCMSNDPDNCYVTQRSKSCKMLINLTSKSITCYTCENSYYKTRSKKKSEKQVHEDEHSCNKTPSKNKNRKQVHEDEHSYNKTPSKNKSKKQVHEDEHSYNKTPSKNKSRKPVHEDEHSYNKTPLKNKSKKQVHEDENKSQLNKKKKCGPERQVVTEITNSENCIETGSLESIPGNTTVTIQSNDKEAMGKSCPLAEEDKSISLSEEDNSIPLLKEDNSIPLSEEDNSVPFSKEDNSIPLSEEDHNNHEQILNLISKMDVPENFAILLKSQLNNCKKGTDIRQRRWDPKIINLCLTLFKRSPQAYYDLKQSGFLQLPSKRLLQYYKNSEKQTP